VSDELDRDRVAGFAAVAMLGVQPGELVPALADGPTEGEELFITRIPESIAENWRRVGALERRPTVLDARPRDLVAFASIYSQVQPWLRKTDERPLSEVLKVVPPRVAENVAFLFHWAGWADLPSARFRLKDDDCDD